MDRPRVIIHNLMSLDGSLDGFPADVGLYYELAARLPHQAILTGSGTMLAAAAGQGVDLSAEDPPPAGAPAAAAAGDGAAAGPDPRPLLVIVDNRGRLTRYAWLRDQPFWRDLLVLCPATAAPDHLARLRRHQVDHLVAGDGRVDLAAALAALAERYQVGALRVDAGGGLNSALLAAGLADEISVVLAPYLAAATGSPALRLLAAAGPTPAALELTAVERLPGGHVWLRYAVRGPLQPS